MSRSLKGHGAEELCQWEAIGVFHAAKWYGWLYWCYDTKGDLKLEWKNPGSHRKEKSCSGLRNIPVLYEARPFLTFIQIYYEQIGEQSTSLSSSFLKGTSLLVHTSLGHCSSKERARLCSCNHMIP